MASHRDILDRIRVFSENNHKLEQERASHPLTIDHAAYNQQLDHTLRHLQDQVKRQESALQQLRLSHSHSQPPLPRPGLDPATRLSQTRRATKAYESLTQTTPSTPFPLTPETPALPTLLALRQTTDQITSLQTSITALASDLNTDRARLKSEESAMRDARLITLGLEERIERLQSTRPGEREKSTAQVGRELVQRERKRKAEMERKAGLLKDALKEFVDGYLAAMLAAEDLGGPVVGDQIVVADRTLEAGYTASGKERKRKDGSGAGAGVDSRQRTIDELVGQGARGEGRSGGVSRKREAAGREMHALLESLLEAAATSGYVELEQDSAASRFLVKAKIAQFHPRDARRLRLINFARELAD
ncbi:hypothetical protein FQN50_009858 [Emmonsiellopsis sp. PD_5]|nr:hypothetical protein FQN50_009858 [Emmonsiellopsis sp. PD_5]